MTGSSAAIQDASIGFGASHAHSSAIDFSFLNERNANGALMTLLSHLQDGVCLFDRDQRLIACNDKYAEIYHIPTELTRPGTTLLQVLQQRIAVKNMPKMEGEAYIANRMKAVRDAKENNEVHHMQDGRVLSVRHKPLPDGGWLTTHSDITEIYGLKQEIEHMAFHDPLTGLANRRRIEGLLEDSIECCAPSQLVALTFVDLDGFKAINDRHGHPTGDEALKVLAERLNGCFREKDIVARLGGDEFAVLQYAVPGPEILPVSAGRIVASLSQPLRLSGGRISVTAGASVGVVYLDDSNARASEVWRQADTCMYDVKRGGGSDYDIRAFDARPSYSAVA